MKATGDKPEYPKARYNDKGWTLTLCITCAKARYCEPHSTTAACVCSAGWTESVSIPWEFSFTGEYIALSQNQRRELARQARECIS